MQSQEGSKDNTNILNQKYMLSHNNIIMGVNINENSCTIIEKSKCRDVEWISLYLQFLVCVLKHC